MIRNLRTNVDCGWLQQVSSGSRSGKAGVASVYRLSYPEHVSSVEPATPVDQVSSMEPASMDQVSPVTPDTPDQVSPVAQPGVISDTPTDPVSNPESSDPLYRSVLEEAQARTAQRQTQPARPLPGWVTDTHVTDAEAKSLDLPSFVARTEREAKYSKPNYLSTLIQRASRVIAGGLVEE